MFLSPAAIRGKLATMSNADQASPDPAATDPVAQSATPAVTALLLATLADLYRQEVGAEEDVHRTLPFFGTALGIVIGALAYAAGRLPQWPDLRTEHAPLAFLAAATLLGLAIFEAACVLVFLSLAIASRSYQRIGPESKLRARIMELEAYYDEQDIVGTARDVGLLDDVRQMLIDSYVATTPANRTLTQQRYKYRARASSHLVRSLIWALLATSVIFVADKLGYLPRIAS